MTEPFDVTTRRTVRYLLDRLAFYEQQDSDNPDDIDDELKLAHTLADVLRPWFGGR